MDCLDTRVLTLFHQRPDSSSMMSGNKGRAATCSWKKPISAKGSRPERQIRKKRQLNMKEKGEMLDSLMLEWDLLALKTFSTLGNLLLEE